MPIGRGVRKVNENVLTDGRAIIITEQDINKYKWEDIPVGSKLIDTEKGLEYVKLEGETSWIPSKIKNDGTLCITKDSIIISEIFTIFNPDEGNGKFSYKNSNGEIRHMPKTEDGYMFELEEGTYQQHRNHLDVIVDDCLFRNAVSGGIIEVGYNRFILTDDELVAGQEITARYIKIFRIGNPYPRFFMMSTYPEESEIGDLWLDMDATLADVDYLGEGQGELEVSRRLPWNRIDSVPTTLDGYGLYNEVKDMIENYRVPYSMIKDAPTWPKYVDAYTVRGHNIGIGAGDIFVIPNDGKIPMNLLPPKVVEVAESTPKIFIQDTEPSAAYRVNDKTIWICTKAGEQCVKVFHNGLWNIMGAVWQ